MSSVTVSSKYQVVIPPKVRERMKIKPGQKIQVFDLNGIIHLVPVVSMEEARGMFGPPFDTTIEREPDREF